MDEKAHLNALQEQVETALRACFQGREPRGDIYDAMEYSLLAGGKRVRPVLTLEVCRMCGGDPALAMPFACAVEMIHTYSLIHDDLPCMDDDDLRRGKPTNHKIYGEATAVLAGDGLLTAAFEIALREDSPLPPQRVVAAAACLARAAGAHGMVGGQVLDMAAEGRAVSRYDVEQLQRLKTGALLSAAAEMGCIVAGGTREEQEAVRLYAEKLGMAFQIRDDMLDLEGNEATLGKPIGSDQANEKTTFVSLLGMDGCRALVKKLTDEAVCALSRFGAERSSFLCWLAEALAGREQ
ncbi:polyprenyl synthetase family protein [Intestinimonas sp.]|uniref:polyprenyl synthetase family protein n=1 Tax=Intestinimonas sp. TaxID=1965293 RepID=UPI002633B03B|nr:farnesyl diphosphate synthase [Intestinimonas sp.]